jgi:pyruvate kinase
MSIRTKIVATLGPASRDRGTIEALAEAGCDVFRINFSHGTEEERGALLDHVRAVEDELDMPLAVLADLCGPKIRVGKVASGITLQRGGRLVIQREPVLGTAERISTTLPELVESVQPGEAVLLDDGRLRLRVADVADDEVRCEVVHGGPLSSGKGINLPQTALHLSALTDKDRADVAWIAQRDVDYVALSFVQSAADVRELRDLLQDHDCSAHIVAKIEKPQALDDIEAIVHEADAIMVARGDLGVEMDLPAVPVAQKQIAALCQRAGKVCIIATQMLETMTHAPRPTRAEVSDVANAVLDRADAVMLSGETAVGQYAVEAVWMMSRIVARAQDCPQGPAEKVLSAPARTTAALAGAVRTLVEAEVIAAAGVFTATGTTARMLSKIRLPVPVLALSQNRTTTRRMCLYYGVQPALSPAPEHTRQVLAQAADLALERDLAQPGDKLVVISGRPIGEPGMTNTLVVHTIPEPE